MTKKINHNIKTLNSFDSSAVRLDQSFADTALKDRYETFLSDVLMQLRGKYSRPVSRTLKNSLEESIRDAFALALNAGELNSLFTAVRRDTEQWVGESFLCYLDLTNNTNR